MFPVVFFLITTLGLRLFAPPASLVWRNRVVSLLFSWHTVLVYGEGVNSFLYRAPWVLNTTTTTTTASFHHFVVTPRGKTTDLQGRGERGRARRESVILDFSISLFPLIPCWIFFSSVKGCHDNIEHSFHGERQPEPFHSLIHLCDAVEKGAIWSLILPGGITNFLYALVIQRLEFPLCTRDEECPYLNYLSLLDYCGLWLGSMYRIHFVQLYSLRIKLSH